MHGGQGGPVRAWFVLSLPPRIRPPHLKMAVTPTKSYNGCSHSVLQNWRTKASGQDSSWDAAEPVSWLPRRPFSLSPHLWVTRGLWPLPYSRSLYQLETRCSIVSRKSHACAKDRADRLTGTPWLWGVGVLQIQIHCLGLSSVPLRDIHGSLLWPKTLWIVW